MLTRSRDRSQSARAIHNLGSGRRFVDEGTARRRATGSAGRIEGLWRHVLGVMRSSGKKTLGGGSEGRSDERCATQKQSFKRGEVRQAGQALGQEQIALAQREWRKGEKKETAMSGLIKTQGCEDYQGSMAKSCFRLGISYSGWSPSTAASGLCTRSLQPRRINGHTSAQALLPTNDCGFIVRSPSQPGPCLSVTLRGEHLSSRSPLP